jgi:hypothetical protein
MIIILPSVAAPMARRTVRVAEVVRLFGYAAGGLPSERLLARPAMPVNINQAKSAKTCCSCPARAGTGA